jgi:transposase InsO family protein
VETLVQLERPLREQLADVDRGLLIVLPHQLVVALGESPNTLAVQAKLPPRDDAETNARTLERALAELAELGLDPPEAVMTDNAWAYTKSRRFQAVLRAADARHIAIPAYTPRWNGKVERFILTLVQEWAYARSFRSSSEQARSLSSFVRYDNRRRPHSSLGGRPPISRVHNVCGEDT